LLYLEHLDECFAVSHRFIKLTPTRLVPEKLARFGVNASHADLNAAIPSEALPYPPVYNHWDMTWPRSFRHGIRSQQRATV
jgi:hypothetical protein